MDHKETSTLYAGRRLIMCAPGFDKRVESSDGQTLFTSEDVWLTDPLLPAEQAIILEPTVRPETLYEMIFGPGDNG